MHKCLGVGIIGYGKMGRLREAAISRKDHIEVKYIYDPNAKDVHIDKQKHSPEAVINSHDIDVVFICTPNFKNFPLTVMALKAGKHVFCEKPPTFTSREMDEVRNIEQVSGKKLMYGFNHRHHASIVQMKAMVDSKQYGNILWMRGRYGKSVDASFYSTWRSKKKYAGGGIFVTLLTPRHS